MSREYTNRVWQQKQLKGGRLLVMLALAEHADAAGECYPGMPLLMDKTRLTDRQLRRVLNALHAEGLIEICERAIGRGKRPHYKLFPNEKADILSDQKEIKADISDNKSGHFRYVKADISGAKQSRARREPITEPTTELTAAPASPAAAAKPKDHLAVQAYRELHERYPTKAQMKIIAERDPPLANWVRAIRQWAANGYNPRNIDRMLEWAFNPALITERIYPNGANKHGTNVRGSPGTNQKDSGGVDEPEYDPERQRQHDEFVAKRKAEGSAYYR